MAVERLNQIAGYFRGGSGGLHKLEEKHPDDVVVTLALRSPLCKSRKGGYKDMQADELLLSFYQALIPKLGIDPKLVNTITVGTVHTPEAPYIARAAALAAGFSVTTSSQVINRWCSSGLMAVQAVANEIRNDETEIGLAVGFESMTVSPGATPHLSESVLAHPDAADSAKTMGWTSEMVCEEFGITRDQIDGFAAMSYQRAEKAQNEGKFEEEIVELEVLQKVDGSSERKKVVVSKDDGIRKGTTKESLAKIKAAFPQWGKGTTTGGNASQVTDGAAAVLLMKRKTAEKLGLKILAKHIATSVIGLEPRIMGIAPSLAIPKVLQRAGLTKDEVDLFEVNEAFGSMYVYTVNKLGLDIEKVNVNGGAIALGHPLGATGARQVATGLSEIRRRKGKVLVTSMCVGTGMGAAAVWIAEY